MKRIYQISYYYSDNEGSEYIVGYSWHRIAKEKYKVIVITSPHSEEKIHNKTFGLIVFNGPISRILDKITNGEHHRKKFIIWTIEVQIFFSLRSRVNDVLHFITPVQGFLPILLSRAIKGRIVNGPKYFFSDDASNNWAIRAKNIFSLMLSPPYKALLRLSLKRDDIFSESSFYKESLNTHSGIISTLRKDKRKASAKKQEIVVAYGRDIPIKNNDCLFNLFSKASSKAPSINFLFFTDAVRLHGEHKNFKCLPLVRRNEFLSILDKCILTVSMSTEQGGVGMIESAIRGAPVFTIRGSGYQKLAQPSDSFIFDTTDEKYIERNSDLLINAASNKELLQHEAQRQLEYLELKGGDSIVRKYMLYFYG